MEREMALMEQVMDITHAYESTALILTVITIGKFFEGFTSKILSIR